MKKAPHGDHSMTVRLGLVGIVAALGVTLPAQPACERWFESVQAWASATLADWDTWKPDDDRSDSRPYDRGGTDCPQCRLVYAKLAAKLRNPVAAAAPPAVAQVNQDPVVSAKPAVEKPAEPASPVASHETTNFEPIAIQEDAYSQIAFELNRMADGIDDPAAASNPSSPALGPSPVWTASWSGCWEPVAASDDLELSLLGAVCGLAGEPAAGAVSAASAKPQPHDGEQPHDGSSVAGRPATDAGADESEITSHEREPGFSADLSEWEFVAVAQLNSAFGLETDCPPRCCLGDAPTALRIAALPDLPQDVFGPAPEAARPEPSRVASAPLEVVTPADPPCIASKPSQVEATPHAPVPPRVAALADLPANVFALPDQPASSCPQQVLTAESKPPAPAIAFDAGAGARPLGAESADAALDHDPRDRASISSVASPRVEHQQLEVGEPLSSARQIVGRRPAEPRLGHAVELTREALYAWMNVLTGPALVDVASH
jgi:hypothetical protein